MTVREEADIRPSHEKRIEETRYPEGARKVMYQSWRSLLFLHWSMAPQVVQQTLPPGLLVDSFNGRAYVGIVPFHMRRIRPRFLPAVGSLSNFEEVNVRTYVFDKFGRPGIWFYSLDANQPIAVKAARFFFSLPYVDAEMSSSERDGETEIVCRRRRDPRAESRFAFRGTDEIPPPVPGTLEYFLVERYRLFAFQAARGRLLTGRVFHSPYPLRSVEVTKYSEALIALAGFDLRGRPPDHQIMSPGVDVEVFRIEAV